MRLLIHAFLELIMDWGPRSRSSIVAVVNSILASMIVLRDTLTQLAAPLRLPFTVQFILNSCQWATVDICNTDSVMSHKDGMILSVHNSPDSDYFHDYIVIYSVLKFKPLFHEPKVEEIVLWQRYDSHTILPPRSYKNRSTCSRKSIRQPNQFKQPYSGHESTS